MSDCPQVSIIVPVYNVSNYIERCATSLFSQTFTDIEFIFVDDCTPDNSVEVLQKTIQKFPQRKGRISILHHSANKGLSAARNTGLKAAKGNFIIHIDSDDFIDEAMIELLYKKATETQADIVTCDLYFTWNNITKEYKHDYSTDNKEFVQLLLSAQTNPCLWTKLIKRDLFLQNDIVWPEGLNMGEDYYIVPIIAYHANIISKVEKPLYYYNQANANAYTKQWSPKLIAENLQLVHLLYSYFENSVDHKIFSQSILQGKLRKKINLLQCVPGSSLSEISKLFPESNSVLSGIRLKKNERIVIRLSNMHLIFILKIYLLLYKTLIKLIFYSRNK